MSSIESAAPQGESAAAAAPRQSLETFGAAHSALHGTNALIGLVVLSVGMSIPYPMLRIIFGYSLSIAGYALWRHRADRVAFARTFCLTSPGYFAMGVQLVNPKLYYSAYERASQIFDITLVMYGLTNLALMSSEAGFWRGRSLRLTGKLGKPWAPLYAEVAGLSVMVCGLALFLSRCGIAGAAWVSFTSYLVTTLIYGFFLFRAEGFSNGWLSGYGADWQALRWAIAGGLTP